MRMIELGVDFMDAQHQSFVTELSQLAPQPDSALLLAFPGLVEALTDHFSQEELLMQRCGFGASQEHRGEHQRLLGQCAMLARFAKRGGAPDILAFMRSDLPKWFETHLLTMDAALARHALDHPA
ncbi:hemerythrin-like metal-binding protein [Magnetococcus marinus MC-1]|uniref:Hemerythrin-like metal-binding protein n=1 Tax=Magnetococcus marinus (strain ATCC BAA-1437 / JCM 17883 / MC-1) TaxID=156889 RepID=A0L6U7_MAGMM|nr:hemerythrin family protein [Magnetococcus marinus]ABK43690.1 hemerythrin-like metal-binding protein [Magnetococcus marinus MC-1]